MNPTTDVFERRIADLTRRRSRDDRAARQPSSAILNLARPATDHPSHSLYGGTFASSTTLRRLGIETRFVDTND